MNHAIDHPDSPVRIDTPLDGVGRIILDRPKQLNALNLAVKAGIQQAVEAFSADAAIKVIVLGGSDKAFAAGTDIAEMCNMSAEDHRTLGTNAVFIAMRGCKKPLIAAVEGYALGGGCELALSCDIIVAGRTARFGQPEIRVGIMPGAGGSQFLLRAAGKYRAAKLCLTGEHFGAEEADRMGLVSEIVDPGQAMARALELSQTICSMPPIAVASIKSALSFGLEATLTEAHTNERSLFERLFDTEDQVEGMTAFLEKRSPRYRGS